MKGIKEIDELTVDFTELDEDVLFAEEASCGGGCGSVTEGVRLPCGVQW